MIRAAVLVVMLCIAIPLPGLSFRTSGGFGIQHAALEGCWSEQRSAFYSLGTDVLLSRSIALGAAWVYYQAGNAPLSGNTVLRGFTAQRAQLYIDHSLLQHRAVNIGYEVFADAWYARYVNTQREFFFLGGGAAPYGEVSLNPRGTAFLRLSAPVSYARRRDVDQHLTVAAEITLRMQARRSSAAP